MTGKRTVHCSRGMLRVGLLLGLAAFNISFRQVMQRHIAWTSQM